MGLVVLTRWIGSFANDSECVEVGALDRIQAGLRPPYLNEVVIELKLPKL